NAAVLLPGDSVLFRRGGVWRGNVFCQEGAEGKPITYSSYGKGNKPIIMGSVPLVKKSDWNQVSGHDNIWITNRAVLSQNKIEYSEAVKNSWICHCDGNAKSKFKAVQNSNSEKEYQITCIDNGKKSSNIQLILTPLKVLKDNILVLRFRAKATIPFTIRRLSLMTRTSPWIKIGNYQGSGVKIEKEWSEHEVSFHVDRSTSDGRITLFIGSVFPKGSVLSIVPLEGYSAQIVESNGIDADVGNMILIEKEKNERITGFKRWSIEELQKQGDYYFEPSGNQVCFYSDVNPALKYRSVEAAVMHVMFTMKPHTVIDGFTITHGGDYGLHGVGDNIVIRNNNFTWLGGGHFMTHDNGVPVRYGNGVEFYGAGRNCLVENNTFSEIYDTAMSFQGDRGVFENILWRNNVVHHCEQAYEIWTKKVETDVKNVVFEYNTCIDCGYCWGHRERPNKRATPLLSYALRSKNLDQTIRYNIFCNSVQNLIWYYNPRLNEVKIDHNIWWDDSINTNLEKEEQLFSWNNDKIKVLFNEYRKRTGNDEHSKIVKPIFADPEHYDYRIVNRNEIGNVGANVHETQP
ncbi:MAG: right-handed parallel beta-helix repeat-containing protein, partial [Thermoguttaceae bacterium]|nr:right-handed parallel beta-helix repeat-containing protein [Thermoguttaceae bacterium]